MKLKLRHVFRMARILKVSGIKEEAKNILNVMDKGNASAVGIDVFLSLIFGIADEESEKMIYDLLADISGKQGSEISELGINEVKEIFMQIGKENDLVNFSRKAAETA